MLLAAEKGTSHPSSASTRSTWSSRRISEPLAGVYSRMGYEVLPARREDRLRHRAISPRGSGAGKRRGRAERRGQVVAAGRHGSFAPLCVCEVSEENEKGRTHTTVARLLPLCCGGYVVDTPGLHQFQLWDVIAEEVAGYYPRIPYLRQPLPVSRLHAHPRGGMCGQGRRGRRPAGQATVRELLSFAQRTRGATGRMEERKDEDRR